MRYIKRKTNVRRHDRECRHKVADVRMHERNLKPRRILGVIPLKNLTYPQAKAIFPSIEPYGDIDEDKVINKRDCRPFDVERQDDEEEMTEQEMQDEIDANIREQEKREEGEKLARQLRFEREMRAELEAAKERLEVNQEEVDENISNILARQRQKEKKGGLWWQK